MTFKGLEDLVTTNLLPHLPQSKSFLKLLDVPFYNNNSPNPVEKSQVEAILSNTDMFNGIILASYPRVIYTSKNSDMAVIWVNIWNSQNGTKAKSLINRSFNFGRHIAIIRGTTMNPGVS